MDIHKAQDAIDEIEAICQKYNIALIGGSVSDDIRGDIKIVELDNLEHDDIDHLSSGNNPSKVNGFTVVNGIS